MNTETTRFPIRFDSAYALLSSLLLIAPEQSSVAIEGSDVVVKMAWAFDARFPKSAVKSTSVLDRSPISRGVHGWNGRWLVNGAGDGILTIDLAPDQRGRVCGFPVKLRKLMISVDDPESVARAITP